VIDILLASYQTTPHHYCVQTGTSIVIRGKGSVKEGRIGTKDGKPLPGADEPLHAYITSDIEENVKKGADRVKLDGRPRNLLFCLNAV